MCFLENTSCVLIDSNGNAEWCPFVSGKRARPKNGRIFLSFWSNTEMVQSVLLLLLQLPILETLSQMLAEEPQERSQEEHPGRERPCPGNFR